MNDIRQIIEVQRAELNQLATEYGLQDPRVLEKSQQLDATLNHYQQLQYPERYKVLCQD
ncbi:Spo0E family sporulation regulatory protein-aspartic acid phosphatase [Paenibacillus enshidis]|uniref:Spo0E family sporulation regulatory protein-aspartic acid phosphatase n=1 Tax=Paenibacillus enshidis TaxID=1458439 RepID=A0ABV5AYG8_9BACL